MPTAVRSIDSIEVFPFMEVMINGLWAVAIVDEVPPAATCLDDSPRCLERQPRASSSCTTDSSKNEVLNDSFGFV